MEETGISYEEAREYLLSAEKKGMVLGLSVMKELLKRLGNPEKELQIVHIAGTNGKGSILSYLEQIFLTAGYHTGRYVSPALGAYEERFLLDQKPVSRERICVWVSKIKKVVEEMEQEKEPLPTIFEIETAMAFLCFQEAEVSVVLLETGMGGRLDATNVIEKPLLSIVASVSMDHMAFLGDNLTAIAKEKAGIIKRDCDTLLYPDNPTKVKEVILNTCQERNSRLFEIDLDEIRLLEENKEGSQFAFLQYSKLTVLLPGFHQVLNAAVAVKAAEILKKSYVIKDIQIEKGIRETRWRARLEKVSDKPLIYLDGAHNPDGAKQLSLFIQKHFRDRKVFGLMGVLRDKEYDVIAKQVLPLMEEVVTITPDHPRALEGEVLKQTALKYCKKVTCINNPRKAMEWLKEQVSQEDVIIAFGSLSFMDQIGDFNGALSENNRA